MQKSTKVLGCVLADERLSMLTPRLWPPTPFHTFRYFDDFHNFIFDVMVFIRRFLLIFLELAGRAEPFKLLLAGQLHTFWNGPSTSLYVVVVYFGWGLIPFLYFRTGFLCGKPIGCPYVTHHVQSGRWSHSELRCSCTCCQTLSLLLPRPRRAFVPFPDTVSTASAPGCCFCSRRHMTLL